MFIDAENEVTRKNAQSFLEEKHISRIVNTYRDYSAEDGYSGIATIDEIEKEGNKLSVSLYVNGLNNEEYDSIEAIEEWESTNESLKLQLSRFNNYFLK